MICIVIRAPFCFLRNAKRGLLQRFAASQASDGLAIARITNETGFIAAEGPHSGAGRGGHGNYLEV
jgi:hypothetical protein